MYVIQRKKFCKPVSETPKGENKMKSYVCDVCGYVYDPADGDPDNGIKPGTEFKDIPDDWVCPNLWCWKR